MLRIAERKLARPHHHLAHVSVDVLARFRDHCVDEPERAIAKHKNKRGAATLRGIGETIDDAQQRVVEATAQERKGLQTVNLVRAQGLWHGPPEASIRIEMRPRVPYHHPQ